MESLQDVYNRGVLSSQAIQQGQNVQAEYEAAKAEEASQKDTMQQAYAMPDTTPLAESYAPAPAIPSAPTNQKADVTLSPTGSPMPSFMGGTQAEAASKSPVDQLAQTAKATVTESKTPLMQVQETQAKASGIQQLLTTNDKAIQVALGKGDHKFAQQLAVQNIDLKNKQAIAQNEHLKALSSTFEVMGQLADGYEAALQANPNDPERAWQQLKMETTLAGFPTQSLDQARTPQERNALIAKANASATTGKEKVQLEIANLKFTAEEEKTKQLAIIADKKSTQADQRIGLLKENLSLKGRAATRAEIKLRTEQGLPVSEEEAKFLNEDVNLTGKPTSDKTQPVNQRYNNPLNLVDISTGKIKQFDTMEEGVLAGKNDLNAKFEGTSKTYQDRFGDTPLTAERLAETWSPASGKGNSPESTANYAKAIANAVGLDTTDILPKDVATKRAVYDAMVSFEGGTPQVASGVKAGDVLKPVVKPTAASVDRAENILENFMQASKDMIGISNLPKTARMSGLAGLSGKDSTTITSSLKGMMSRGLTPADEEMFQTFASGFDAAMATAIGGGYATSSSAGRMKSYEKQLPREGQSPEAGLMFLARAKDEMHTIEEGFALRGGASDDQKKRMKAYIKQIDKAVPFTVAQVEAARSKGKESLASSGKKLVNNSYTPSIEQQATLDKYGL